MIDALTALRASGWIPALLLAAALAITPIARVLHGVRGVTWARAPRIRRALGIATACAALTTAFWVIVSQAVFG